MRFTISVADANSRDALQLMGELDAELRRRYPQKSIHGLEPSEAMIFLIARNEGRPVGCGALRQISGDTVEIKRMYVRLDHRKRGFSRQILQRLESIAVDSGYEMVRLETGDRQPESIGLYESSGYNRIPRYGEYANDPHSICFEKTLRSEGKEI